LESLFSLATVVVDDWVFGLSGLWSTQTPSPTTGTHQRNHFQLAQNCVPERAVL